MTARHVRVSLISAAVGSCALLIAVMALYSHDVHAEESDGVARLVDSLKDASHEEAISKLEEALAEAHDTKRVTQLRRALAQRLVAADKLGDAVAMYEALTRGSDSHEATASDLIELGAARFALARHEAGRGGVNAVVTPLLIDAVDATNGLSVKPDSSLSSALRRSLLTSRAGALRWQGKHKEAANLFQAANPNSFDETHRKSLWDQCARAHYGAKNYKEAAKAFAHAGNPRGAAAAWSAAKNREEALKVYRSLMQDALSSPDNKGAASFATVSAEAFRSSRFFHGFAELDAIAEALKPATETQRAHVLAFRASIREARGDEASAIALLRKSLAVIEKRGTPAEVARTRVNLGRLLVAVTGDGADEARKQAVDHFLAAIDEPSTKADAVYILGQLAGIYDRRMWMDPDAVEACLRIQRALTKAAPENATVWSNLGNSLRRAGLTKDSLEAYEKAAALDDEDPVLRSDHGLALAAAGQFDEALRAFEASVAIDESYLAGYQNAARQLVLLGNANNAPVNSAPVKRASAHLGRAVQLARREDRRPGTYRFLWEQAWRIQRRSALR